MFINSLSLIFEYTQLIGPLELLIVSCCLFGLLYISLPLPGRLPVVADHSKLGLYQYLYRTWNGELALNFMFWPFFIILNGALYGADYLVKSGLISVSSWGNIHMMLVVPVIWWTGAVWRGTGRAESRGWSACVRLAVLGAYFEFGLRAYIRIEFPRIFFNCEGLLLDYFSCF